MTWYYRVKKWLTERFNQDCRVICRGNGKGPRNVLIEFEDGGRYVVPRFAVRRR